MKQNDFDELLKAAEGGDGKGIERLGKSAAATLSSEQRSQIEKAMSDPEYLRSLLSTPRAQEILKKFQGGDK